MNFGLLECFCGVFRKFLLYDHGRYMRNLHGNCFRRLRFSCERNVRELSGASGSKDEDNVEESGATGATGFCGRRSSSFGAAGIVDFVSASFGAGSFAAETGTTGFAGRTLGVTFATGADVACCGAEPIRSPGKRMPQ